MRRIEAARWLGFMPCCYCVRAGMDVLHLQALLGHASLDMVQHYAQMVNDDLIQAHQAHSHKHIHLLTTFHIFANLKEKYHISGHFNFNLPIECNKENLKMSEILQDFSEPALVHAIEANLFEFFPLFRKWPRMEVHDDPDYLWSITNIPFPIFNSVLRAQITPDHVDSAIELATTRCKLQDVPLMWWTGPATRPPDLGTHLERHGFSRDDDETGMAVELKKLNEGQTAPPGLIIEQVRDSAALKQWCHVFAVGFGFPEPVSQDFFDCFASLGFGDELAIHHYLGWFKGEPVASSSLLLGAGVAGIYNVASLPDVRRKGFGAAMTLRPLIDARAMGYQVGILQASQMGASVYSRLGFQEYCKIGIYIWEGGHKDHSTS